MKTIFKYSLVVLSGLLLLLSFPPFDLEFLARIALVPVLVAISYERQFRFKKVAWLGVAAMAVVFIPHWFDPWRTEMEGWIPASWSWVGYPTAIILGYFIALLWGAELVGSWKPAQIPAQRLRYLMPALWIIALPA